MVAWILEDAGLDPGFLIGGIPINFGVSARLGKQADFVIEADEYDTAFFDKRSKMVHYRPRLAVLNNIEFDHADIFVDLAAIETQFHHFVRTIPASGKLIVNGADPTIDRVLARGCWSAVERFGVGDGWSANAVGPGRFEIFNHGRLIGLLRLALQGEHNLQNALAAIAAAQAAGVDPRQAIQALARFKGVRRRMELRGTVAGVAVWDDFAHHPTAVTTTVSGLRKQVGSARILAVLELRSSTMRAGLMKDRLPASLEQADRIFCFSANLGWDVAAALAPIGDRVRIESDLEQLVGAIVAEAQSGDQVLVMSNGGFGGIHERLLASLSTRAAPATGA
jgi:UDP-N-acetylmuramate: L-alanyl-gamma-D-glutamyl-meso-diaminopimelate ligase